MLRYLRCLFTHGRVGLPSIVTLIRRSVPWWMVWCSKLPAVGYLQSHALPKCLKHEAMLETTKHGLPLVLPMHGCQEPLATIVEIHHGAGLCRGTELCMGIEVPWSGSMTLIGTPCDWVSANVSGANVSGGWSAACLTGSRDSAYLTGMIILRQRDRLCVDGRCWGHQYEMRWNERARDRITCSL